MTGCGDDLPHSPDYVRDAENNQITLPIYHLSEFALLGVEFKENFLPILWR